ncbi:hypothetical protein T4D_2506 [Trichinella pseudospiralis]|uniref:Uncharacterized protein n=1 Tax=Trichinella pseudospiralis TaxID=6337 RepID=A0A0V1DM81_TRIPS|nr:hypothetical protein T4D_2506 [Trichinella pseudospiralis]
MILLQHYYPLQLDYNAIPIVYQLSSLKAASLYN